MTNMPLISIIVPAYNASPYLDACIDSIVRQTYTHIEVIIVNDGSADDTRLKAEAWAAQDSRVKVINQGNGGQTNARRTGVKAADGIYVGFVDADDWIEGNTVERMIRHLLQNHENMVMCTYRREYGEISGEAAVLEKNGVYSGRELAERAIHDSIFFKLRIGTLLVLAYFEKSLIEAVLEEADERIIYAEDVTCILACLLKAERVGVIDEPFYHYRQHAMSITYHPTGDAFESGKHLYRFLFHKFRQHQAPPVMYHGLKWLVFRDLLIYGYSWFFSYDYLFPYPKVRKGSRIVLYGAGKFGNGLYRELNKNGSYRICLWVDQRWELLQSCMGYEKLESPERVLEISFDFIVIANIRTDIGHEIYEQLVEMGIDREKIACLSQELLTRSALPKEYTNGLCGECRSR